MELMEIILLIAGGIIFVLSFFIPDKGGQNAGMDKETAEAEIKKMVEREMEAIRGHVDDVVDEAVAYSMEKTERSLERLSNEKIMAVSEYSDTVLAEIHKNHEEAMFLYDMLNSKHINIKDTVSEVNRTMKEAEVTVSGIKSAMQEPIVTQSESVAAQIKQTEIAVAEESEKGTATPKKQAASKKKTGTATAVFDSAVSMEESIVPDRMRFEQDSDATGQNNNEKILELYRQGKSTVAIAKELGLGVGEVKLVIGLYKNQ